MKKGEMLLFLSTNIYGCHDVRSAANQQYQHFMYTPLPAVGSRGGGGGGDVQRSRFTYKSFIYILFANVLSRGTKQALHMYQNSSWQSSLHMYMWWFKFILGLNSIFFCVKLVILHYHSQNKKERKFKPG